ncbi:MAG TPA: ATP-binding cassette domain-containing protein [Pirellulaceae bacterium]|nr:ATP-binding cassette domain-containing protein [Pirellulaceae bacterium]
MSHLHFDCRFSYPAGFTLNLALETTTHITALWGPSGCGKTTTLHLIAGLLRPAAGRIVLNDRVLFDGERRIHVPIDARQIGLVCQDYQLFPHLTVEQNLRYGLRRARSNPFNLAHLIEVLELAPFLQRYPAALSGGQKQRVALGRAIASQPALLLLDEPVSALEHDLRWEVLAYLGRIVAEYAITTMLVSHDRAAVEQLGASIVSLAPAR